MAVEQLMIGPRAMGVGWWIELPIRDDGSTAWAQVAGLIPPVFNEDDRWVVHVRRGSLDWWVRIAPRLCFPVCDVDPT
jgi:hypothetical protein